MTATSFEARAKALRVLYLKNGLIRVERRQKVTKWLAKLIALSALSTFIFGEGPFSWWWFLAIIIPGVSEQLGIWQIRQLKLEIDKLEKFLSEQGYDYMRFLV